MTMRAGGCCELSAAVGLSAQGVAVAKIATATLTSTGRVRDVIHNFTTDGFASPYPKYQDGRPKTFTLLERREP
jgi:hypothetical protein